MTTNSSLAWGTLGPESIGSQRRVRTLGLGAAVRACNEAAVPGTGGLWYSKQLLFAALGIRLAAGGGASNIRIANAIEALACLLGFSEPGMQDARLRGRRKLAGISPDTSFITVSKPGFYVTQPMRMGMGEPLVSLGFAFSPGPSRRFNALALTDTGHAFVNEALSPFRPYKRTVVDHLLKWIADETCNNNTPALRNALSPVIEMPERARSMLAEQLAKGEGSRRRTSIMTWLGNTKRSNQWTGRPMEIETEHWNDLVAGARFLTTRKAALACLDAVESHMARHGLLTLSATAACKLKAISDSLSAAKRSANDLLALEWLPDGAQDAASFARVLASEQPLKVLQFLVKSDGRILVGHGDEIARGSAFDASSALAQEDTENDPDTQDAGGSISLPPDISERVRNLALLCLDLDNRLDRWLKTENLRSVGRDAQ